jgi:hypothetical protein
MKIQSVLFWTLTLPLFFSAGNGRAENTTPVPSGYTWGHGDYTPGVWQPPANNGANNPQQTQPQQPQGPSQAELKAQRQQQLVAEQRKLEAEQAAAQAIFDADKASALSNIKDISTGDELKIKTIDSDPSSSSDAFQDQLDQPWHGNRIKAPLTNSEDNRNAHDYSKVIDQFGVDTSVRYQPTSNTFCNVFVQDVTDAMHDPLPQTNTDEMVKWLHAQQTRDDDQGWHTIDIYTAEKMANDGRPTIAIRPGHVLMVRPGSVGDERGPAVAQAGDEDTIMEAGHLKNTNTRTLKPAALERYEFWYHN